MNKLYHTDDNTHRTSNGSIDYNYYTNRAHDMRGAELRRSFKSLFSGKKNS